MGDFLECSFEPEYSEDKIHFPHIKSAMLCHFGILNMHLTRGEEGDKYLVHTQFVTVLTL